MTDIIDTARRVLEQKDGRYILPAGEVIAAAPILSQAVIDQEARVRELEATLGRYKKALEASRGLGTP